MRFYVDLMLLCVVIYVSIVSSRFAFHVLVFRCSLEEKNYCFKRRFAALREVKENSGNLATTTVQRQQLALAGFST